MLNKVSMNPAAPNSTTPEWYYVAKPNSFTVEDRCGFCRGRLYKKEVLGHSGHVVGHAKCIKEWIAARGSFNCVICQREMDPISLLSWKERGWLLLRNITDLNEKIALFVGSLFGMGLKIAESGLMPQVVPAAALYLSVLSGIDPGKRAVRFAALEGLRLSLKLRSLTATDQESEDERLDMLRKHFLVGINGGALMGLAAACLVYRIALEMSLSIDQGHWWIRAPLLGMPTGGALGACIKAFNIMMEGRRLDDDGDLVGIFFV